MSQDVLSLGNEVVFLKETILKLYGMMGSMQQEMHLLREENQRLQESLPASNKRALPAYESNPQSIYRPAASLTFFTEEIDKETSPQMQKPLHNN